MFVRYHHFEIPPIGPFSWLVVMIVAIWAIVSLAGVGRRRRGVQAAMRVCPQCGTAHPPHARFCRNCGHSL